MNRIITFLCMLAALVVFSSCAKAPASSSQSGDDYSVNEKILPQSKSRFLAIPTTAAIHHSG